MEKILKDIARSLKSIDDSLKKIERNMRTESNTMEFDEIISQAVNEQLD